MIELTGTERLRNLFAQFLENRGYREVLVPDGCSTVQQDDLLKYERIDRYRVLMLTQKDLKTILKFGEKHGIAIWLGCDKLCVGFNCRQNMRLSAYDSVAQRSGPRMIPEDRNVSVLRGASSCDRDPDRILRTIDHHLDVHGGVD